MLPTALYEITGHKTLKAAWEEPDRILKREYAEVVEEIKELRKERNRLCHGAWTEFATPEKATVRYFPNGEELDNVHRAARSLDELRETSGRVMAIMAALRTEEEEPQIHRGSKALWEGLGRTVATFGMLEDTLARALYVITGHEGVEDGEAGRQQAQEWAQSLISLMSDTLGGLACELEAAWTISDGLLTAEHAEVVAKIKALAKDRNLLCHGTWHHETRSPDELRTTRERVIAVIAALRTEVRVTYKTGFPGANDF